ncbi:MAG: hypothetical protein ACKO9Q_25625, partial [Pirellula sp.]
LGELEIQVRPRRNSRAICSRCGTDQDDESQVRSKEPCYRYRDSQSASEHLHDLLHWVDTDLFRRVV